MNSWNFEHFFKKICIHKVKKNVTVKLTNKIFVFEYSNFSNNSYKNSKNIFIFANECYQIMISILIILENPRSLNNGISVAKWITIFNSYYTEIWYKHSRARNYFLVFWNPATNLRCISNLWIPFHWNKIVLKFHYMN